MTSTRARRVVLVSAIAVAVAAIGVVVGLSLTGSSTSSGGKKHHRVEPCSAAGCAVVSKVQTAPAVVLYSGASCQGLPGPWFLNVVQGGSSVEPRLSYRLDWSFISGSESAQPNGTISVSGGGNTLRATLKDGTETISGVYGGAPVNARGSLQIRLAQSPSAATLVFTEAGLTGAERELHITSPFVVGGSALSLPITVSHDYKGC